MLLYFKNIYKILFRNARETYVLAVYKYVWVCVCVRVCERAERVFREHVYHTYQYSGVILYSGVIPSGVMLKSVFLPLLN